MSRAALLYGDEALLNEYNERVDEKLNAKSSEGTCAKTVGVIRGMQQMILDIETYDPFNSHVGMHSNIGAHFDAKKEFYRLISLLLSDLGMIFDIRSPSPWQIISSLLTRGIISVSESVDMRVCLSFANEVRLKTYFANHEQKELISPLPRYVNRTQQSADAAVLQDVDQDILVRFLSTSNDIHRRCAQFTVNCISQGKIDGSIFRYTPVASSNALLLGHYYCRLQNFHEALKWMKSESKDSPYYANCLVGQGNIYLHSGEYDKSIECFEEALQLGYKKNSYPDVLNLYLSLAKALCEVGKYKMAIDRLEGAICKHSEIVGETEFHTITLIDLLLDLSSAYYALGDEGLAVKTLKKAQEIQKELPNVPDMLVASLNIKMADMLSELDQYAQSIECIERALQLSHKVFSEYNLSIILAQTYSVAGSVYGRCNLNDEAVSLFKRSLELYQRIIGDDPHPGKIRVLSDLGAFFVRRHQTKKAVEYLKSALNLARAVNDKKPHKNLAEILSNIGAALVYAGKFDESLPYFKEAKEIMDQLLGRNHSHPLTSTILYKMGTSYCKLGDLSKALRCCEDAFNINCALYGENSNCGDMESVCSNLAFTLEKMGSYGEAKEYHTKAIKIARTIPLTKNNCCIVIGNLYHLASTCWVLGEQNDTSKHLEEARKIARDTGFKDWMVVCVLVQLTKKYAKMGSMSRSIMCYLEAGEIARSLPNEDSLPHSILEMRELMKM